MPEKCNFQGTLLPLCMCGCGYNVSKPLHKFIYRHSQRGRTPNKGKHWKLTNPRNPGKRLGMHYNIKIPRIGINNPMFGRTEEKNPAWKGDLAGERAMHNWIWKLLGKANHCEVNPNHGATIYHWACLNHQYTRNPEDYAQLCPSCHENYDMGKITVRGKTIIERNGKSIYPGRRKIKQCQRA